MEHEKPVIAADKHLPEITLKVLLTAIPLAILLATANTYLALKIGLLTSASIPAAVLAMGILRFFKRANILENNLIQTCASAGEAVAGGVVFTAPALIIIRYWTHFDYWQTAGIALIGGILGVLFSIPIRRTLVHNKKLPFPEGRAISEVLKFNMEQSSGFRELLLGGTIGGLIELAQTGFKIIASQIQVWFARGNTLYGFGFGFSATMIGAGYLIGFNIGLSIFIGAIISWVIGIPTITSFIDPIHGDITHRVMQFWDQDMRYVGIGAMLTAGLWTVSSLYQPLRASIKVSKQLFKTTDQLPLRTEYDIPLPLVGLGLLFIMFWSYWFFYQYFDLQVLGIAHALHIPFLIGSILYIIVIGFLFAAICGYFSGMVGVSASPGSAVIIAGMLLAALLIRAVLSLHGSISGMQLRQGAAITIYLGAIITGSSCIANDNIQDLKVGHLVGSTPWKQQFMLLLGAVVAALIIPLVMEVLFNAYGIAGVFPHAGMDPSKALPAPPAAVMATITQGVFHDNLPWNMVGIGALTVLILILINNMLKRRGKSFSVLGVAIGMYLPITTSTPLFIGSLVAMLAKRKLNQGSGSSTTDKDSKKHCGLLLACGLVAGAAIMDVIIAIPMALAHNPDMLRLMPLHWMFISHYFGIITLILLSCWLYWTVVGKRDKA